MSVTYRHLGMVTCGCGAFALIFHILLQVDCGGKFRVPKFFEPLNFRLHAPLAALALIATTLYLSSSH
ncbi:hypothetical protein EDB19DRAFT_1693687 [Suillus lakei]|nr:hypothetical protein EDB19DRAFT_1693687 [Suillus lakei]